jgi:transcriptional repressor NrdR
MRCPFCGSDDTQVKDSRPTEENGAIRRRRFCGTCGQRFTTVERVQLRDLTVVKSDGRRVPFDRDKPTKQIGELVMDTLKELDKVAYVRFASVYRNFREAKDFEDFVGSLAGDAKGG